MGLLRVLLPPGDVARCELDAEACVAAALGEGTSQEATGKLSLIGMVEPTTAATALTNAVAAVVGRLSEVAGYAPSRSDVE